MDDGALGEFRLEPHDRVEGVVVGAVRYIDFDKKPVADPSMVERFFHKDRSFSYESEFRAAISLRMAEECGASVPDKGIKVPVDLHGLVDSVRVSPVVSNAALADIRAHAQLCGLRCDIARSALSCWFV
jgi:hypothetical protein